MPFATNGSKMLLHPQATRKRLLVQGFPPAARRVMRGFVAGGLLEAARALGVFNENAVSMGFDVTVRTIYGISVFTYVRGAVVLGLVVTVMDNSEWN